MTANIQLVLILKYGSVQNAFQEWILNKNAVFTADEFKFLADHAKKTYPNLTLIGPSRQKG